MYIQGAYSCTSCSKSVNGSGLTRCCLSPSYSPFYDCPKLLVPFRQTVSSTLSEHYVAYIIKTVRAHASQLKQGMHRLSQVGSTFNWTHALHKLSLRAVHSSYLNMIYILCYLTVQELSWSYASIL